MTPVDVLRHMTRDERARALLLVTEEWRKRGMHLRPWKPKRRRKSAGGEA